MFSKIMVPVDLAHADRLERALAVAADLANRWQAEVVYVGATGGAPGSVAHTPEEYRARLEAFAAEEGRKHGQPASAHALVLHDVAADLDHALVAASEETGADLVVMATHPPGIADWLWPGHGGRLAAQARASTLVVRG